MGKAILYKEEEDNLIEVNSIEELGLTPMQDKKLQYAINYIVENDMKQGAHVVRSLKVTMGIYGTLILNIKTSNNKKRSFGYVFPNSHQLFIGRAGGYTAYRTGFRDKSKKVAVSGRKALIYC